MRVHVETIVSNLVRIYLLDYVEQTRDSDRRQQYDVRLINENLLRLNV
jgi:hypothetical protein